MTAQRGNGVEWEWEPVDATLELTVIWLIREYMKRRQATIAEYDTGRPI